MHFDRIPFRGRSLREGKVSPLSGIRNDSVFLPFTTPALSRRRFLGAFATSAGMGLGSSIGMPMLARAAGRRAMELSSSDTDDGPQHLPGGISIAGQLSGCPSQLAIAHFFGPGATNENSTIWDFDGSIGVAAGLVNGTGNLGGTAQTFTGVHVDMRFLKGSYVGLDGMVHQGAFAFI